jgi:hypothetical protein
MKIECVGGLRLALRLFHKRLRIGAIILIRDREMVAAAAALSKLPENAFAGMRSWSEALRRGKSCNVDVTRISNETYIGKRCHVIEYFSCDHP